MGGANSKKGAKKAKRKKGEEPSPSALEAETKARTVWKGSGKFYALSRAVSVGEVPYDTHATRLDPIGQLARVRALGTKDPSFEYTFGWPEPGGELKPLATLWHCTRYVAIGKYHDETVHESDSMLLSEGARAVALTSSTGEIEWTHLGNRILEALLDDAVTLVHWKKSLSDSQLARFDGGAGRIAREMVKHIKAVVGNARQSPKEGPGGDTSGASTNKESGAARAPPDGGKRLAQSAERAERERAERRERIASVLDGATKDVSKLGNGLDLPKGNSRALKMLYDVMPRQTREALFGLRDMAKDRPFEVVEYLKCFVNRVDENGFPDADDPKYFEYSRDMCEKSAPLRQLRDMKSTEKALWELAVRRRHETLAYFYYVLMPKLA